WNQGKATLVTSFWTSSCCPVEFWNQGKAKSESVPQGNACCPVEFWNQGKAVPAKCFEMAPKT
ncbi:MAG: hypothetical protein ACPGUY_03120, partial [Akkermansiaceae bacterium]